MKTATVSIMPTVNNQKRPDLYHTAEMSTDLPADALGEAVAETMQKVWASGYDPVADMVELNIRFA